MKDTTKENNLKNRDLIIDCAPGMPRPNVYYEDICEKILHIKPTEPLSTFFGAWTWKVDYESEEQRKKVGEFLSKCYKANLIRYGEW